MPRNALTQLADDLTGAALGLRLPPGKLVKAGHGGEMRGPVLWFADDQAVPETWAQLSGARSVGLLPVLIQTDNRRRKSFPTWNLDPGAMSDPGCHDAEEVLGGHWTLWANYTDSLKDDPERKDRWPEEDIDETLAPYGRLWPGMAARVTAPQGPDPDAFAIEMAADMVEKDQFDDPRAALVPAGRSADIPAAMGWLGSQAHGSDVAPLCAVLRSWEDRFGLRLVALGRASLTTAIVAPPRTLAEAEAVAAEHFGFCPDNITQGDYETLREYAHNRVLDGRIWHFWWD